MPSAKTFNFAASFQVASDTVVIEDAKAIYDGNRVACGLYDL
jgi:hypothetical protein